VKKAVVVEREFNNIRLASEDVAEFDSSPGSGEETYRMVVVTCPHLLYHSLC